MQFLYPGFLWALAFLAIPVIIHLFYFRRFKKVYFSNVRLLKEIKEETQSRSRLKNWLLLLSRLLLLAALVFAFAQPFIPSGKEVLKGAKAVSIFVDNSFSLQAKQSEITLLDLAKKRAEEIVDAYRDIDRFQIISQDLKSVQQRWLSPQEAKSAILDLQLGHHSHPLSRIIARQNEAFQDIDHPNRISYWISDFQESMMNPEFVLDSQVIWNAVMLENAETPNIGIDSAWFLAPVKLKGQSNQLMVKLKNYGVEPSESVRLSIKYNGQEKPIGRYDLAPGESRIDTTEISAFESGWQEAVLEITDYPVSFDDSYHLSFQVEEKINIAVITDQSISTHLKAALDGIEYFSWAAFQSGSLDYSVFNEYDLILLNGISSISSGLSRAITQYVFSGGNIWVIPGRNSELDGYNRLLQQINAGQLRSGTSRVKNVNQINTEEFTFSGVFQNDQARIQLPQTQFDYPIQSYRNRGAIAIMRYRDGAAYLVKQKHGEGQVYILSSPLDIKSNNLVKQAEVFVPLLFKMGLSARNQQKIAYTIGANEVIIIDNPGVTEGQLIRAYSEDGLIPGQAIHGSSVHLQTFGNIIEAGVVPFFLGQNPIAKIAFNYDRKESNWKFLQPQQLLEQAGSQLNVMTSGIRDSLTQEIREQDQGIVLWKWFVIMALIFLVLEILIARFWKR